MKGGGRNCYLGNARIDPATFSVGLPLVARLSYVYCVSCPELHLLCYIDLKQLLWPFVPSMVSDCFCKYMFVAGRYSSSWYTWISIVLNCFCKDMFVGAGSYIWYTWGADGFNLLLKEH